MPLKQSIQAAIDAVKAARDALDDLDEDSNAFEDVEEELREARANLGLIQSAIQTASTKVKDPTKLKLVRVKKVLNFEVVVPADMEDEKILENFQFNPEADNYLTIWLNPQDTQSEYANREVSIEDNLDWTESWEGEVEVLEEDLPEDNPRNPLRLVTKRVPVSARE